MLNDFYTAALISSSESNAQYEVSFTENHDVFVGHFPGQPVVPGVCTTAITKALLEKAIGMKLRMSEAKQIKFLQLLTPEVQPVASIKWILKENGRYGLDSTWTVGDKAVYKLSAEMAVV